ncbi:MAG TPA: ABC transporter permease, partial [Terriglobales bacterium]
MTDSSKGSIREWFRNALSGLRALFRRKTYDRDLNEELDAFLTLAAEDKVGQGMSPSEARRAVRLEKGSLHGVSEAVRSAGWESAVESTWLDVRQGARRLRRAPGFAAVAIITLGLGIGANTAIFSVVNRVLLRPLPYRDAGRLVTIWSRPNGAGAVLDQVSSPDYADWKAQSHSFASMGAATDATYSMTGAGDPVSVIAYRFSSDFFKTLGVPAVLGRTFLPEEDQPGKDLEVVLSYRLWRTRFGGDPAAIGRSVWLDDKPHRIVGVMPSSFQYPSGVELWTPLTTDPTLAGNRGARWLRVMARLKDGVTPAQAEAEMTTLAARLQLRYPATNRNEGVAMISLRQRFAGSARPALLALLVAVGLVLLIACANLANLLLSRAMRRHGEIALRMALGASRLRIVRQLVTESLLLSLAGGALGIAIAWWSANALVAMFPKTVANVNLPMIDSIPLDGWVLTFAVVVSLITGMLFGLAPALLVSHARPRLGLRGAGHGTVPGSGTNRFRNLMVVLEMALSLMLLIAAGLVSKSFIQLATAKLGF